MINLNYIFKLKDFYIIKRWEIYNIGLMFSGGKDSLIILNIIKHIVNSVLIYINHNNNIYNKLNIIKIFKLASLFNIKLLIKGLRVNEYNKFNKGIEAFNRFKRIKSIINISRLKNIKLIIMAHHLKDLIENFFIRLFKCNNIKALIGFNKSLKVSNILIIRPLLNTDINILRKILNINLIVYDKDNYKLIYTRNYIRFIISKFIIFRIPLILINILKLLNILNLYIR